MHQNNLHNKNYNLKELAKSEDILAQFIIKGKKGNQTIDFSNPIAVKALNTALIRKYYGIKYWSFPDENLCPPIPGRVDYIHYLADLIGKKIKNPKILDIGIGATAIYPLLGQTIYKWAFVGTDVDKKTIETATKIVKRNKLESKIALRLQTDKSKIFKGIINPGEQYAASMCNPPFFKSLEEANEANQRKQKNLGIDSKERNFGGKNNELSYPGGEKAFLHNYLYESSLYKDQVNWFTILVSNKKHVKGMYISLKKLEATKIRTIEMRLGNKVSRVVAWTFR